MQNCLVDCIDYFSNHTVSAACDFAKQYCLQDTFPFIQGYYCGFHQSVSVLVILSIIVFFLVFHAIQTATDHFLTPTLEDLTKKLGMSDALAGITFLALANGAPDIITAVVAGTSSSDTTMLIPFGSLYGAALFSMAFIMAQVIKFYPSGITLNLSQSLTPLTFYIFGTLYLVCVSFFYQKMNMVLALLFSSLYLMYQSVNEDIFALQYTMKGKNIDVSQQKEQQVNSMKEEIEDNSQKSNFKRINDSLETLWKFIFKWTVPNLRQNKQTVIISGILSPFALGFAYGIDQSFTSQKMIIQPIVWFVILAVILLLLFLTIKENRIVGILFDIYSFIITVAWITFIVGILINLIELIQLLTNINSVFLGLTVLAGAASIGDYMSITNFAKKGNNSTAITGIFSGQLLNFLIGFGATLIINSISGQYQFVIFKIQDSTQDTISNFIVFLVIFLSFIFMAGMLILLITKKGQLEHKYSKIFVIFYSAFILATLILSITSDYFNQFVCPLIQT